MGRVATAGEVLDVVLRDEAYYDESGGGMTLSGGEPLMQPDFAAALLQEAKAQGLHCCVETSGYAMWGSIRPLLPLVDLWLYDIKETDRARHETFIGAFARPRSGLSVGWLAMLRLAPSFTRVSLRCLPKRWSTRKTMFGRRPRAFWPGWGRQRGNPFRR